MTKSLRDALADAAGGAAFVPPEHEIELRSRRLRRNAWLLQGGAVVAVLSLLTAGVLAAATTDSGSTAQRVTAAGAPEPPPVEEATTTTTTAVPVSTTTPPPAPTAAVPRPKAKAATAPRAPRTGRTGNLGPRAPGSVVFAFEAGRTSWSGTSNGMHLTLTIDKATPRAGEPVTFTMSGSMADRPCCDLYMVFGDGGSSGQSDTGYCSHGNARPTATSATKQATHVYNKAGRWEFLFGGSSRTCGDNMAYGALYGVVEVAPGTGTSQGPSRPTITVARYGPTANDHDPSYVSVHGKARDEDGFIAKLVVDYGDGTTEQFPGDGMGCKQSPSGWPSASMGWTPTNPPPTHRYAARGTYTITITAYSQGCDGRDVQSVSGSFEHVF